MIRGVSFEIPQTIDNVLFQILKCINIEKYNWYNIENQNEVWANHNGGISLESDKYDGKSFLENITSEHYVIFIKLQAYFEKGKFFDIHTYEDFQNSECQLLLLIYDCTFVEIFVKNQVIIKALYENALANNYTEVEYITDNNDGRTKMDIL